MVQDFLALREPYRNKMGKYLICISYFSLCIYAWNLKPTRPKIAFFEKSDPQFQMHEDTLYQNETKYTGKEFALYPNNDTASVASFAKGLLEGIQKKYYPKHILAESRNYHRGEKIGRHVGFWENSLPKFDYYFEKNEHQGSFKEWYNNGKPFKYFHYSKGYESGSQRMWWENGIIRANYYVKNGRRFGLIGLKLCLNPKDSLAKPKSRI